MEALFLKLVNMSITASWLVLAIIAVRLVFKKTPKWILCLLWGLVAFRLICPFSIESALSLIPNPEPLPQEIIYTAHPEIQSGVAIIDNTVNSILESSLTPANPAASANPTQIWSFILSQVWILGVVLMLLYTLGSYLLLKHKVATAIPLGKGIKQSEFVDSPFVLGMIRPVIYLPFDMEEKDLAYVLAHEKAHIHRRDHWWKPIGFLLLSVYWFNPVMWVAYILLCRDIEAACDEKVVKDMEKDDRQAYSTALLNCSIHRRRIAACPLAFGETGVKDRVKGVMNYKKPAFWVILIALIVCIIVAVCFLTNPKSEEEQDYGYDLIQAVISQDGYQILAQDSTKVNLVIEKDKLPEDCFTLSGHTFEAKEVIPYQTYADNILYLQHVGIDKERSEYLRFTFVFQTDSLDKENLLLPYHVDIESNGFVCNVEVNSGEVWDNREIYKNAAYFDPVMNGEGFCVLVKKAICENAGHHIAFMLNDMNRLTFGVREIVSPVTISAENATPSGVTILFHQNQDLINGSLICGHEFFLQKNVNGQWKDIPTKEAEFLNQTYDIALLHHHGINWERMYGKLDVGSYRLGKVIPITSGENPEYTTIYAEFTIDNVYIWFDLYSTNPDERYPKDNVVDLFGMDGTALSYDSSENEIRIVNADGIEPVISCDVIIRNAFLTDLTGDGVSEICATVQMETDLHVQVYDSVEKQLYELPTSDSYSYLLTKKADRLCVLQNDRSTGYNVGYGILALTDNPLGSGKHLEIQEIDNTLQPLTRIVSCVDIAPRKRVCLSSQEEIDTILSLLYDLENQLQPVPRTELQAVQEDYFNNVDITINYVLGEKVVHFSKDYSMVWESGSQEGYLIDDPAPLRTFVESITDGVRGKEITGEPFATVDTPWDWCANINSGAVETAQAHVCLYADSGRSSATMGPISVATLQELISVLNQIPKESITADRMIASQTYDDIYSNQQEENSSMSIVDGVNNIAVIIRQHDGQLEMLLTDEMDKVTNDNHTYLEPTQLWVIRDQALMEFMQAISEHPPVITYSIGAEYDWQDPIEFTMDSFSLNLRLIEGWDYEHVANADNSGVRCRPKGITDGWIYFSYWPDEYSQKEENRYINEGLYYDWTYYTSYPDSVVTEHGFSTHNAIWSYQRYDLETGDFVVINEGADAWFLDYEDQISDIIMLSQITSN